MSQTASTQSTGNIDPAHGSAVAGHDSMTGEPSPVRPNQAGRYVNHGRGPLPPMPKIGLPEETYLHVAHKAERNGDDLVFEAAKVGQYVSLALRDPDAPWTTKLKFFRHALKRHTQPPEHADEMTKQWFGRLGRLVKAHAGAEALRLAVEMDEVYEARVSMGQTPEQIADDAEKFFDQICPMCDHCPPIYNEEEWQKLTSIRDRWI